jgi:Tol biopolymer transport system component
MELDLFRDFRRGVAVPSADARARASGRLARVIDGAAARGFRARSRSNVRRAVVLAIAGFVVVLAAASAFATVRVLFFASTPWAVPGHATWSPDGRKIAYVVGGTRAGDPFVVYVVNADGSDKRNLTRQWGLDFNVFPIWSPDWKRIAFVPDPCTDVGACTRFSHIYVMNADGSALRRLARGGKVRRIWSGQGVCPCAAGPVWSPDGRRIAFGSEQDGPVDLYITNRDGKAERRLTRNAEEEGSLTWSPDGRRIAVVVQSRKGTGPVTSNHLYVVSADGSDRRLLGRGQAPTWSPDGRKIAFRSDRDGNGEVYVVNADGSGLRRVTRNPASDGRPVWSPDGTRLLFTRFGDGSSDIYSVSADGSGARNLTPDVRPARVGRDSSPAWSPDGTKILFVGQRDGRYDVWVMNADGSGKRNLTQLRGGN